jgi:AcrR family transcriptional regulator
MDDLAQNPRQKTILSAAWQAFAAYGFRRTSMDDIARGAGMSRPALYLHYRNKEDIFRSLVKFYYDGAVIAVDAALQAPGTAPEVLARAFAAQGGELIEAMLTSPHGLEMLDTGTTIAADIAADGEARLTGLYARWLETGAQAGRLRLTGTPPVMAQTITAALKGIKSAGPDHATYVAQVAQLAALIGTGLEV